MRIEPATVLVIELGSLSFFFLVLPLVVVLASLRGVWRMSRGTGLVLTGVVVLTAIFFLLLFIGLVAVTFFGASVT